RGAGQGSTGTGRDPARRRLPRLLGRGVGSGPYAGQGRGDAAGLPRGAPPAGRSRRPDDRRRLRPLPGRRDGGRDGLRPRARRGRCALRPSGGQARLLSAGRRGALSATPRARADARSPPHRPEPRLRRGRAARARPLARPGGRSRQQARRAARASPRRQLPGRPPGQARRARRTRPAVPRGSRRGRAALPRRAVPDGGHGRGDSGLPRQAPSGLEAPIIAAPLVVAFPGRAPLGACRFRSSKPVVPPEEIPMAETILVEREGRVAIITVNRPDKLNALSQQVRDEVLEALAAIEGDDSAGAVVLTGAGEKSFIAGADISEFAGRSPLDQRHAMRSPRIFDAMATFPKPVIAMINGFCLGGGCELAASCDLRIASDKARFGQPEIKLGLIPGGGGSQRLPRLIGTGQTMRLILSGDMIGAEEAKAIGLVEMVFPADELRAKTLE